MQCSTISFAKWVKGIDFSKMMSKTIQKRLASHSLETVFTLQSSKNFRSIGGEMFGLSKEVRTFGERTTPQLASPLVDILKDMPMDCLKVFEIKLPFYRSLS